MKSKLRGLYLLTSIFLTVIMMIAAMIAWTALAEPYIAERWTSDICVAGSIKSVLVGRVKRSSVLKCTSKETGNEIFVPSDKQIGSLPILPICLIIALLRAPLIVFGARLLFKAKVPS